MLGSLTLSRAYDHCERCETGLCPRDHALGLQGGSLSPAVTRMVGIVGAMVSFVESGCKVAIGTRLTRTGMHWTVAGADAIIALRCCRLSGRFEDFRERRSARAGAAAA